MRRFSRSGAIVYAAAVYNPVLDPQTGRPKLTQQVEIYHDGKLLYTSSVREVMLDEPGNARQVTCQGQLQLNNFPVGDFMIHLIAVDTLAKRQSARADQWMDFSVR